MTDDSQSWELEHEFKCAQCDEVFDTRGKRIHHVDNVHRQCVDIKFPDGTMKTIIRNGNGEFACACERVYQHGNSLARHAKLCKFLKEEHKKEQVKGTITSLFLPQLIMPVDIIFRN